MRNPFWWETLMHNVALLRRAPLNPTGLPAGLVADGLGQIYAKGTRLGRYYNFINTLILVSTSRLSWATEKTCLSLEAIPGLLLQLIHFHRIVSPSEFLVLPQSPDGFVSYRPFIDWLIDMQKWPSEEVDVLSVPAFRLAVQDLRTPEVVENTQRVLEIIEESQVALREGAEPSAAIPKAPIELIKEQLRGKEAIIETLQTEIDSVQAKIKSLQERLENVQPAEPKLEAPLAGPSTPSTFVLEEEHAIMTAAMAQEIRRLDKLLSEMEGPGSKEEAPPPPPLSLARDIGLATTGRTPRPSDVENLEQLKLLNTRLAKFKDENEALKQELEKLKGNLE